MQQVSLQAPRLSTILDDYNPIPEYKTDDRIDALARVRLGQLIASRQRPVANDQLDIDTIFRSITSRDTVILVEEPSIVEPGDGWTVLRRGIPLEQSHYAASLVNNPIGRKVYNNSPSARAWLAAVTFRPPQVHIPAAISLLDWLAGNYVHFLDLIINRIRLADKVGIAKNIPLLLSKDVAKRPFCRDFLELNPEIRNRVLVIDAAIRVDKLYLIRTTLDSKESYDFSRSRIPTPPPVGNDRLLLVRRIGAQGRTLENGSEVEDICRGFGFRPYDPGADPLVLQAQRLAKARFVVSTHGAGLSNTIFRAGGKLGVLELFPPQTIRDHFFIIARHYGFDYYALVGESDSECTSLIEMNTASFRVDAGALERKLKQMENDL